MLYNASLKKVFIAIYIVVSFSIAFDTITITNISAASRVDWLNNLRKLNEILGAAGVPLTFKGYWDIIQGLIQGNGKNGISRKDVDFLKNKIVTLEDSLIELESCQKKSLVETGEIRKLENHQKTSLITIEKLKAFTDFLNATVEKMDNQLLDLEKKTGKTAKINRDHIEGLENDMKNLIKKIDNLESINANISALETHMKILEDELNELKYRNDKCRLSVGDGIYEGECNERREPHGYGVMYFPKTRERYQGYFKNGIREGFGVHHFSDDDEKIEGYWKNGNCYKM